jgi:hypothetical protein
MVERINLTEENHDANDFKLPPLSLSKGKAKDLQNTQTKPHQRGNPSLLDKRSVAHNKMRSEVLDPIK